MVPVDRLAQVDHRVLSVLDFLAHPESNNSTIKKKILGGKNIINVQVDPEVQASRLFRKLPVEKEGGHLIYRRHRIFLLQPFLRQLPLFPVRRPHQAVPWDRAFRSNPEVLDDQVCLAFLLVLEYPVVLVVQQDPNKRRNECRKKGNICYLCALARRQIHLFLFVQSYPEVPKNERQEGFVYVKKGELTR